MDYKLYCKRWVKLGNDSSVPETDGVAVPLHRRNSLLNTKCAVLFFILPASLYFWRNWLPFKIIPLVLVLALIGCLLLRKDVTFNLRALWVAPSPFIHLKSMLAFPCSGYPGHCLCILIGLGWNLHIGAIR